MQPAAAAGLKIFCLDAAGAQLEHLQQGLIVVVGQGCRQRSWEVAGDSHPLHRGINGVE